MKKVLLAWMVLAMTILLNAAEIPINKKLITGQLDNGMRYTIMANPKPKNRAEFRLLIKAGSLEEDNDQRGIAHFVEHMAFNGTRHFKKNELISYLESTGVAFGSHLNASTGYERTLYKLTVPLKDDNLEKSFLVFRDWADGLNFNPEEFDKERGVILEEARIRDNIGRRLFLASRHLYMGDTRYMQREPIGDLGIIKNIPVARAKAFYDDWYRPELMHFVAVGDFNATQIKSLITKHFTSLKNKCSKKTTKRALPDDNTTRVVTITDKELTSNSLAVNYIDVIDPTRTDKDVRDTIVQSMAYALFNLKAKEQRRKANPNALTLRMQPTLINSTHGAHAFAAGYKSGNKLAALKELYALIASYDKHGFSQINLNLIKKQMLAANEKSYKRRDDQRSSAIISALYNAIRTGSIYADYDYLYTLKKKLIHAISLNEVNREFRKMIALKNRAILFIDTIGKQEPKEAILSVVASAYQNTKDLSQAAGLPDKLITKKLSPVAITQETHNPKTGVYRYQLANGITVDFKPTDFTKNSFVFQGYSLGGLSQLPDTSLVHGKKASRFVMGSGAGTYTALDLEKVLAGKRIKTDVIIAGHDDIIKGGGSSDDVHSLFEVLYLELTQPRIDPAYATNLKRKIITQLEEAHKSPRYTFHKELVKFYRYDHPRMRYDTVEDIQKLDADRMLAIYKERLSDFNNFHFAIVGDLKPETVKELITTYLGNLPTQKRSESYIDHNITFRKGKQQFVQHTNNDNISHINIIYQVPLAYTRENRLSQGALRNILNVRLRNLIREEKSGVYGIHVGARLIRIPKQKSVVTISFSCDPERRDELLKDIYSAIETIKHKGVNEKEMNVFRKQALTGYETNLRNNGYWLGKMILAHKFKKPLETIFDVPKKLQNITPKMVRSIALKVFGPNRLEAQLNPKPKETKDGNPAIMRTKTKQ